MTATRAVRIIPTFTVYVRCDDCGGRFWWLINSRRICGACRVKFPELSSAR